MDVPAITSAGKPCKLCKAKGRKCHLHGGTPRTPSPKRSPKSLKRTPSPKRSPVRRLSPNTKPVSDLDDLFGSFESPKARANRKSPLKTPKEFHYLNSLPKLALQEVMLNMEWNDLMNLCATNKRANTIFNNPTFLGKWDVRHRKPIFGTFKIIWTNPTKKRDTLTDFKKTKVDIWSKPSGRLRNITITFPGKDDTTAQVEINKESGETYFMLLAYNLKRHENDRAYLETLYNLIQRPEYIQMSDRDVAIAMLLELKQNMIESSIELSSGISPRELIDEAIDYLQTL